MSQVKDVVLGIFEVEGGSCPLPSVRRDFLYYKASQMSMKFLVV
jgi:hypothetical protein